MGGGASLSGVTQLNTTESPFNELGNAENPRYTSMGSAISMTDRIALACRFLPKGNLIMYLRRCWECCTAGFIEQCAHYVDLTFSLHSILTAQRGRAMH